MERTKQTFGTFLEACLERALQAGLEGNRQQLELITISAIRRAKTESSPLSEKLAQLLAQNTATGSPLRRAKDAFLFPVDADEGFSLIRALPSDDVTKPIFEPSLQGRISQFVTERKECARLLAEGISPPRTILLSGPPGTGKTMLARWLAKELGLEANLFDLATAISSYLGKTGANVRKALDYARNRPSVLLIDEFDAIAKRRDDATELGELKRIVNVLLKELEEWPLHSVLIAATNHVTLLDPAIHRRFDVSLHIPLPNFEARQEILRVYLGRFQSEISEGFISGLATMTEGESGSSIQSLIYAAIRSHLTTAEPMPVACARSLAMTNGNLNGEEFSRVLKETKAASGFSVRELAVLFQKSSSAIQYHLKGKHEREH